MASCTRSGRWLSMNQLCRTASWCSPDECWKPGSEVELVPGAVSGPGVREWLASPGRLEVAGAAFDTRLQGLPAFTGRASKSIRRLLARHGARITASPESFLVQGLTGALAGGRTGAGPRLGTAPG